MAEPHHTEAYLKWENKKYPSTTVLQSIQAIKEPTFQALAAFLYLTGCRISEVIPYVGKQDWKDKSGIRRQQVIQDPANPNKIRITGVRNLKRRIYRSHKLYSNDNTSYTFVPDMARPNKYADLYRDIGFSVGKEEKPFWDIFISYANTVPPGMELFPLKYETCYYALCMRTYKNKEGEVIVKLGGMINPHAIRHQRFTQFVDKYRLDPQQLRRKAGWKSSLTADFYVESSPIDMIEQEEQVQQKENTKPT
jgi:integrase